MFQTLPNETVIKIFKNLNRSELLKVSEVSKRFYDAATDSSLWKDFDISHKSLEDKIKILQLSRCKKLKTLTLTDSNGGVNNEILKILMKIDLEKLTLERVNFESIDKVLLANVISKTKVVHLISPGNLEQYQVNMIMKMIPGSDIKELLIEGVRFSGVDSRTVAEAINSLETFKEGNNHFNEEQTMETLEEMSKKTNLKEIMLNTWFLENVPARFLSKVLNKLHCLHISGLTSNQIMEIFKEMSYQTNLHQLVLLFPEDSEDFLISFPVDILTKAISKLKVFMAPQLKFSESQIKSVFQSIDSSKIQALDLGSCHEPQFSLLDNESLVSVSQKIKGYKTFKAILLIKHLEMSIEELQKVQEENDEMKEEEKKMSAEEISKRWLKLAWSLKIFGKNRIQRDDIFKNIPEIRNLYLNIRYRIEVAFTTISQLQPGLGLSPQFINSDNVWL